MGSERKTGSAKVGDGSNGAPPEAQLAGDAGIDNLDQVRDILFGADIRKYEQRLERLEERLMQEIGALRQDTKSGIESLASSVEKELGALADQLKGEQSTRSAALEGIAGDLKQTGSDHQAGMARLDEQLSAAARGVRQDLVDESKSLRDEIRQSQEQTTGALEREAQALRDSKTDRAALSELLMEMAMRLNDDLESPEDAQ